MPHEGRPALRADQEGIPVFDPDVPATELAVDLHHPTSLMATSSQCGPAWTPASGSCAAYSALSTRSRVNCWPMTSGL